MLMALGLQNSLLIGGASSHPSLRWACASSMGIHKANSYGGWHEQICWPTKDKEVSAAPLISG